MKEARPSVDVPEKDRTRNNQKLKIMYVYKILLENTDKDHSMTLEDIKAKLSFYDVTAERKSLYKDIQELRRFGLDIEMTQANRTYYYKVVNRQFDLPELKLLVDSVQSAKFITAEKSYELIKKIEQLASKNEAGQLQRQLTVTGRSKALNNEVMQNVDMIHHAIASGLQISFKYFAWNTKKEPELKYNGNAIARSPWGLIWYEENYYLLAYDEQADIIKYYRVDKMLEMKVLATPRLGKDKFDAINMQDFSKKTFGMFEGEEQHVKLLCENYMANIMVDRFGKDIHMLKVDDGHFTVSVKVQISSHFIGWIISLGTGVKIIAPDELVERVRVDIEKLKELYS